MMECVHFGENENVPGPNSSGLDEILYVVMGNVLPICDVFVYFIITIYCFWCAY